MIRRILSPAPVPHPNGSAPADRSASIFALTIPATAKPSMIEPLLVDVPGAGRILGISRAAVYRLRAAGKLPAPVKLGGKVMYRLSDLREFVACGCDVQRMRK